MKNIKTSFLNLLRMTTGSNEYHQAAIDLLVELLEQEDMFLGRIPPVSEPAKKIINIDEGVENSDWIKHAHVDVEQDEEATELVTVGWLVAELGKRDSRMPVFVQIDGAGNRYKPVMGIYGNSRYNSLTDRVGIDVLTDELRAQRFTEADTEHGIPCIVLQV